MTAHFAKFLDVANEVPRRVVVEACERLGAAAAALVEQENVIQFGVELLALLGTAAGTGPAMKEYRRLAAPRTAPLPVDAVTVAHIEHSGLERLDRRVKGAALVHAVPS